MPTPAGGFYESPLRVKGVIKEVWPILLSEHSVFGARVVPTGEPLWVFRKVKAALSVVERLAQATPERALTKATSAITLLISTVFPDSTCGPGWLSSCSPPGTGKRGRGVGVSGEGPWGLLAPSPDSRNLGGQRLRL